LGTRNWEEAEEEKLPALKAKYKPAAAPPSPEPITINRAWKEFLTDAKARNLREPTLYKYDLLSRQMDLFAQDRGLRYLRECDLSVLREFRASWPNRNLGAQKKLEYLRKFFRFGYESKWIDENHARKLESPKVQQSPTMPFTPDQMAEILSACEKHGKKARGGRYSGPENARRIRAFVLLLRHSGLRIGDAVTLERRRIIADKLLLYTAKTGTPVYLPLPTFVLSALEVMPKISRTCFFWTGESEIGSATGDWQRTLKAVFKEAGIPDGHAHRFRDTLAVELLQAGVPMDRVSMVLGHSSIRVTEKHYSPWVRARQEQLEADVRRTWGQPLPETKGTLQVQEKQALPN
jgi:integrase